MLTDLSHPRNAAPLLMTLCMPRLAEWLDARCRHATARHIICFPCPALPCTPPQVLYAFHASRGNWQSAAAAMLALSRRLVAEGEGGPAALNQAELALGAVVSALRCGPAGSNAIPCF